MKSIKADKSNYGGSRKHSDVKFIVIHYTGNNNDKAENNGKYFQGKDRKASAHFFVGQDGTIVKSVGLNKIAWGVGGAKWSDCSTTGGGKYYGVVTNSNSVSIELCDNVLLDPSEEQIQGVIKVIKYIRKYCKNANSLVRHFDVNGKHCPARMIDSAADGRSKWYKFKARVYKDAGMDK